jgi:hypothetical protein
VKAPSRSPSPLITHHYCGQARFYKFAETLIPHSRYSPTRSHSVKKLKDGAKSSLRQLRTFKTHVRIFGSEIAVYLRSGTRR